MEPLHPDVSITMKGKTGKPVVIVNAVVKALGKAGLPDAAVDFKTEAMSGSYTELLATVKRWVTVK